MINPLYLPELREMLTEGDTNGLSEFCQALIPARTADFMEGLSADEIHRVLQHADIDRRVEIVQYFDLPRQVEMIESMNRPEAAQLVGGLASDDRVDLLNACDPKIVDELLTLLPTEERREVLHLRSYPEGTAGAVMTTEVAKLSETLKPREALERVQHFTEDFETIYYLYIVDEQDHLRGLVSFRSLISSLSKEDTTLGGIMDTGLVTATVREDQEDVAAKVARYDLLAIPVVDEQHRILGIITHDDIMDVVREEATEDAHRSGAVEPLAESYLKTSLLTLAWKRGIWLFILFGAALLTAFALKQYESIQATFKWLVLFIPLVISSGGNSGNQSATLVITGMRTGDILLSDWAKVVTRELLLGLILGGFLAICGLAAAYGIEDEAKDIMGGMWVIPVTVMSVVVCGAIVGAILPMIFERLGLDPALMSNPFVAGIIDIVGVVVYMNVAIALLT